MKILLTFFFLFFHEAIWACPGCAGSMNNPKDAYLVYILGGFIILVYIPFYLMYRLVKKHRNSEIVEP